MSQVDVNLLRKSRGKAPESGRGSKEDDYSFVLPKGFYASKSGNWLETEVFMVQVVLERASLGGGSEEYALFMHISLACMGELLARFGEVSPFHVSRLCVSMCLALNYPREASSCLNKS